MNLRINNELTPKEYESAKATTLGLRSDLNNKKKKLSEDKLEWIDNLEKKYNLLDSLSRKFELGSVKQKRELLIALGEKFVVNKGQLEITLKSWLQPIAKTHNSLESNYYEFEPIIEGSVEPSISQSETLLSIRRGRPDSNRRSSA